MSELRDIEAELAALAAYHCGRFAGAMSRLALSPAEGAHGFWLLMQQAEMLRESILKRTPTTENTED